MTIKAIETCYKGYRFRSRLEARWAVYFDAAGIEWEYEKEGYRLSNNLGAYLPDFWLPQVEMWAEVKPTFFSHLEICKCWDLALLTGYPCLMLDEVPDNKSYWGVEPLNETDACFTDYFLDGSYLSERRFYANTGVTYPDKADGRDYGDACRTRAVNLARSARFEHGESGLVRA